MNAASHRHGTAITVINLKGGVGKTHTVWLLAGVCQERGKKLLVIDTDTQGNITKSLLSPAWNPIPGVAALSIRARTSIPGISYAPRGNAVQGCSPGGGAARRQPRAHL